MCAGLAPVPLNVVMTNTPQVFAKARPPPCCRRWRPTSRPSSSLVAFRSAAASVLFVGHIPVAPPLRSREISPCRLERLDQPLFHLDFLSQLVVFPMLLEDRVNQLLLGHGRHLGLEGLLLLLLLRASPALLLLSLPLPRRQHTPSADMPPGLMCGK